MVLCHTRELAYQIQREYQRFSKYLPDVKSAVFYGGINIKQNVETLENEKPQIIVGTPGRILDLGTYSYYIQWYVQYIIEYNKS